MSYNLKNKCFVFTTSFFSIVIFLFGCNFKSKENNKEIFYTNDGIVSEENYYDSIHNLIRKKTYYENGKERSDEEFKDGVRNGIAIYFDKNGVKSVVDKYENDTIVGSLLEYYINGQLKSVKRIRMGHLISSISYNEVGNIINTSPFVSVVSNSDTVKLGSPYKAVIRFNSPPREDGELTICLLDVGEDGKDTGGCTPLNVNDKEAVFSVTSKEIGKYYFSGVAIYDVKHPLKDSIIFNSATKFEHYYWVVK